MARRILCTALLVAAAAIAACDDPSPESSPVDAAPAVDAAPPDAAPPNADAAPPDAAAPDAAAPDAAPPDAAPPDAAPPNAAPPNADAAVVRPPIFVPGPPAETYDCTAVGPLPDRRSPVPIDCPIDPECRQPMVVAHRGAGGQLGAIAPENSLAGIRAALVMGVDGVELDVRHTADDGLVLMHDDTVDRTTFGTGRVSEMRLEEVTALALRRPYHPDTPGDFSCSRVPTFAEALALTGGRVFIDLDTKTDRVDLVVPAIVAAGLIDEVFISVSSASRAAAARAIDPSVRVQIRPDNPEEYAADLALFDRPPEIVEIPSTRVATMAPAIHDAGLTVFADVFAEDVAVFVRRDGALYRDLYAAGADVLQTELPPLVLTALGR